MRHKTQKQPKPKIVRTANSMCAYVTNSKSSSNNLPSYPPDSHQYQNAVYWRTKCKRAQQRPLVSCMTKLSVRGAFRTFLREAQRKGSVKRKF